MKKFDEVFVKEVILGRIKNAQSEAIANMNFDSEYYEVCICQMVDEAFGRYIPSNVCAILGISPEEINKNVLKNGDGEYRCESTGEWLSEEEWIANYEYIHDFLLWVECSYCDEFNLILEDKGIEGFVVMGYNHNG